MELIIIIFVIIAIVNGFHKESKEKTSSTNTYENENRDYKSTASRDYSAPRTTTSTGNEEWQKRARENIEKAARRAEKIANEALREILYEETPGMRAQKEKKEEDRSAQEQIRMRRMETRTTSILERAKGNASENREDVTLNTMEAEHHHSERVASAQHHHPEDIIPENMLGSIEDLMIKGYDGSLCFERDFVGEGMDMISRFTVPSDIPEY